MDELVVVPSRDACTAVVHFERIYPDLKYWIPLDSRFRARANVYCYLHVCDTIKECLSAIDYATLSRSCLGYVLTLSEDVRINFQLLHHMLLHEVITKKNRELWFKVNGVPLRFSLAEFHVVSGLPCVDLGESNPAEVTLQSFFGLKKCSYDQLLKFFREEPTSSSKKLIMAKLLLVEFVLLYRRSKSVSKEYLSLACDADRFERYHWGKESYYLLINSLKKLSLVNSDKLTDRCVYELYGYHVPFQIWIVEAVPALGRQLGYNLNHKDDDPFSLRWSCKLKQSYDELATMFSSPLYPIFTCYGEFARKPGMVFDDEKADPTVDSILTIPFVCDERNDLFNTKHIRVYLHRLRFDANAPPLPIHLRNINGKRNTRQSEDADFVSPKKSKKLKISDSKAKGKKGKLVETRITRKGKGSSKLIHGNSTIVKDKKSASSEVGLEFKIQRNIVANVVDDNEVVANQDIVPVDADINDGGFKVVEELETIGEAADTRDEEGDDLHVVSDESHDFEGNHPPFADTTPAWATPLFSRLDSIESTCKEFENIGQAADTQDVEGDGLNDATDGSHGFEDNPQPSADSVPAWATSLFSRLGFVESKCKEIWNIGVSLQKRISYLEARVEKEPASDSFADILEMFKKLVDRVTALELNAARTNIPNSSNDDSVSDKIIVDILGSIKNQHLSDLPNDLYADKDLNSSVRNCKSVKPILVSDTTAVVEDSVKKPSFQDFSPKNVMRRGIPLVASFFMKDVVCRDDSTKNITILGGSLVESEMIKESRCPDDSTNNMVLPAVLPENPELIIESSCIADSSNHEVLTDVAMNDSKMMKEASLPADSTINVVLTGVALEVSDPMKVACCITDSTNIVKPIDAVMEDSDLMKDAVYNSGSPNNELLKGVSLEDSDSMKDDSCRDDFPQNEVLKGADLAVSDANIVHGSTSDLGCDSDVRDICQKEAVAALNSLKTLVHTEAVVEGTGSETDVGNDCADELASLVTRRSSRLPKSSRDLISSNNYRGEKKKINIPVKKPNSMVSDEDHRDFYTFYRDPSQTQVRGFDRWLNKTFFRLILRKNGWLVDPHISEAMYHMRKRVHEEDEIFSEVVILDLVFHQRFNEDGAQQLDASADIDMDFVEYFIGAFPSDYGKTWVGAKRIYTPFNIRNKHLIVLEVKVEERVVYVYDCNSGIFDDVELFAALSPFCMFVPVLMKKSRLFGDDFDDSPFTISRVPNVSQDGTNASCVIFTIKLLEAVVFGGDVSALTDEKIYFYRELMAIDLFKQRWSFRF